MIPALAQSLPAPDKDFTWQAILLAAAVLSALSTVVTIWVAVRGSKTTISPNPLEFKSTVEWASKQSVDELRRLVDSNQREIVAALGALSRERENSVSGVYRKLEECITENRREQRADTTSLREDIRGLNERLNSISEAVGGTRGELKRIPSQSGD